MQRKWWFRAVILVLMVASVGAFAAKVLKLPLQSAVTMGLQRNLDLMKKRLEIKYKRMAANEAFRAFLPQVSLSFNRAVTVRKYEQDSRQYRYELSVDQLVYDGGKVKNTYKLAMADYQIARKIMQTEERAIRLQILTSFAKVIGGRASIEQYKKFLLASKKELQLSDIEVRLGTTTVTDRDEIATRYETAKLELLQKREEYYLAQTAFRQLLRIPAHRKIRLVGNIEKGFKIVPLLFTEKVLFEFAQSQRIDFAKSFLEYRKAVFEYNTIKRSWLPDVSLSAKLFLSGPNYSPNEKGYSFFLKFSFPFFGSPVSGNSSLSGGNEQSTGSTISISPFQDISYLRKLAQAKSGRFFAVLNKQELPETVKREIRIAVAGLKLSAMRFAISRKQLDILKRRIKVLELKVKLGESKRLDLAKARIELYKAQVGRLNHIVEYITTAFKLETTVGMMPGSLRLFTSSVFSFR